MALSAYHNYQRVQRTPAAIRNTNNAAADRGDRYRANVHVYVHDDNIRADDDADDDWDYVHVHNDDDDYSRADDDRDHVQYHDNHVRTYDDPKYYAHARGYYAEGNEAGLWRIGFTACDLQQIS